MADGNSDLREQAKQWMEWDPNDRTRQVVADALESSSSSEASSSASGPESATAAKSLKELFGSRLEFGTAGLRGPMSAGSSGINDLVVLQTAQGICAYAQQVFGMEELRRRGVVFGFDHRQHPQLNISSRRFAEISAAVFLSQEVPVLLFSDLVATPFVPFCIVERECCLGVMVTASHNPKEDNGYKIYWADGVQITPPHDTGISNAIAQNLEPWAKVKALLQADASGDKSIASATTDPTKEISAAYFQKSTEALARHPAAGGEDSVGFDVVYTAMHGVGHVFARQMFQAFGLPAFIPVESQVEPDAAFPTVRKPNPEEKGALDQAKKTASASDGRNKLILANDPDADRLAVAEYDTSDEGSWREFSGNEIGIMLASWQWRNRSTPDDSDRQASQDDSSEAARFGMLTTAVSTQMLARMAEVEGFRYMETLTGFKWLGAGALRLVGEGVRVLFCFEEAIGFCLSDKVFDKDGVTAAAAFAELATDCYAKGLTVGKYMDSLYAKYGHFVSENSYFTYDPSKSSTVTDIFAQLRNSGRYLLFCGSYQVSRVIDVTRGFDSSADDLRSSLPATPSSEMIVFHFSNGCVITVRTSGTEPKLKYYCEMCGKPGVPRSEVQNNLQATVQAFIEHGVRPDEFGLHQ